MKAILIFILSAALVLQCVSAADAPGTPYLKAKNEAWELTYGEIAKVHYTYTGYAKCAAKTLKKNKGGQPAFGDSCGLEKAGKAYEDAQVNFRDARYSMRITWNPYQVAQTKSAYDKANSAMESAKKNYESKLACDEKAFKTWFEKLNKNKYNKSYKGIKTEHWAYYIQVERKTYRHLGLRFSSTFLASYVQGDDKCGVRSKWYEWIKLQHKTNWLEFKQKFDGGEWLKKGDAAEVLSRAKVAELEKAVECDEAIPTPPAALKEINKATEYDIKKIKIIWGQVAQAKKRNDPCQLEAVGTNYIIAAQTYRLYNHLKLSARTTAQKTKYGKLADKALAEQVKVGDVWGNAKNCDKQDGVAKKAVAAAAAKANDAKKAVAAAAAKSNDAKKGVADVAAKAKEVIAANEKTKVSQVELKKINDDLEVEYTFAEHEKKLEVDGKESRRLSAFSN